MPNLEGKLHYNGNGTTNRETYQAPPEQSVDAQDQGLAYASQGLLHCLKPWAMDPF